MAAQFAFGGITNAFLVPPVTKFFGGKTSVVVQKCLIALLLLSVAQLVGYYLPINQFYEMEIFVAISLIWAIFQYTMAVSSTC